MEKKETQMDVMIQETRQYIMDNLTITSMSNEELEDKIEELIFEKTRMDSFQSRKRFKWFRKFTVPFVVLVFWIPFYRMIT